MKLKAYILHLQTILETHGDLEVEQFNDGWWDAIEPDMLPEVEIAIYDHPCGVIKEGQQFVSI